MKRLLVTGASGLLGLNLILQAGDRYEMVGVLRSQHLAPRANLPFRPFYADLSQPEQIGPILDQVEPDGVIHCAAMTDVDFCELHPEDAALINTSLPEKVAGEACRRGIPLLHISTDAVFDGLHGNYCEEDVPHPVNVYARTKLEGELRVLQSYPGALVGRVNFYGWSWQGHRSLAEWFYNNLSRGLPVRGFTNLEFCPLLVNQMVEILLKMFEMGLNGLYHVVSSEAQSKFEFGKMLARQFGFDESLISHHQFHTGDLRAPRSRNLTLSCDKLTQVLGQTLPGQVESMQAFYELHRSGYPGLLRSVFERPG